MNTPYTTRQAMVARYGAEEISALEDTGNNIEQLADDANALVDSFVPNAYTKPLAVIPAILTFIASDIARWLAYRSGGPETVEKRYEEAMGFLTKRLATSKFELPAANLTSTGTAYFEARKRVFTRDNDTSGTPDADFTNATN